MKADMETADIASMRNKRREILTWITDSGCQSLLERKEEHYEFYISE